LATERPSSGRDPWLLAAWLAPLPLWGAGWFWSSPAIDPLWPLHRPRDLLFLVVLYPVAEEWLFRGLLQGWLLERPALARSWHGWTGANLVTATVFTALHFISHPPLAAAAVLAPALVFGFFRDRYGTLRWPMLLHGWYNLGYFWIFASG